MPWVSGHHQGHTWDMTHGSLAHVSTCYRKGSPWSWPFSYLFVFVQNLLIKVGVLIKIVTPQHGNLPPISGALQAPNILPLPWPTV